jgi:histone acetyltransferase (RNA polymerase elongator complex component)
VKIFPVFIPHAGCPHQCLFCAQDKTNSQNKAPQPDQVLAWLDEVLPQHGGGEVAFYGGSFSLLPREQQAAYLEVAGQFVTAGRVGSVRISTRPDAVQADVLEYLWAGGVRTIELGCQSFSDKILSIAERGHDAVESVAAVKRCKERGFSVGVQLMPGLPGDNAQTSLSSMHVALNLAPAFLRIYPAVVIAGTQLAKLWQDKVYEPWSLEKTVDLCAEMLLLCRRADVPVVRLGLQQDPQLEANLLAGPYHPAFGQLVRSRLWRRLLADAAGDKQEIKINPSDFSDVIGHRGENKAWFATHMDTLCLKVDDSVDRGMLRIAGRDFSFSDIPLSGT